MQAPLSLQHVGWANRCNLPASTISRQASFSPVCVSRDCWPPATFCSLRRHHLPLFRASSPRIGLCLTRRCWWSCGLFLISDVIAKTPSTSFVAAPGWALIRVLSSRLPAPHSYCQFHGTIQPSSLSLKPTCREKDLSRLILLANLCSTCHHLLLFRDHTRTSTICHKAVYNNTTGSTDLHRHGFVDCLSLVHSRRFGPSCPSMIDNLRCYLRRLPANNITRIVHNH